MVQDTRSRRLPPGLPAPASTGRRLVLRTGGVSSQTLILPRELVKVWKLRSGVVRTTGTLLCKTKVLSSCGCREEGGTDESSHSPAKHTHTAGSEATQQLAACRVLICMHFTCHQKAASKV